MTFQHVLPGAVFSMLLRVQTRASLPPFWSKNPAKVLDYAPPLVPPTNNRGGVFYAPSSEGDKLDFALFLKRETLPKPYILCTPNPWRNRPIGAPNYKEGPHPLDSALLPTKKEKP